MVESKKIFERKLLVVHSLGLCSRQQHVSSFAETSLIYDTCIVPYSVIFCGAKESRISLTMGDSMLSNKEKVLQRPGNLEPMLFADAGF